MFNDYFYNDTDVYLQTIETVDYESLYFSSLAYGYEGAMNLQVKMNDYQQYCIIEEQY